MKLHPVVILSLDKIISSFFETKLIKDQWRLANYQEPSWFCGSAEILANICKRHSHKDGSVTIMVPYYFCGQSLRYLRSTNVNIIFYNLDSNLIPKYKDVEKKLTKYNPDLFLHVHYFGQISEQENVRKMCDFHNMLMIEDCAHVIHPVIKDKWLGDYLFFSPHKFFPVKNGSVCYSKRLTNLLYPDNRVKFPFFWYMKRYISSFKSKKSINCNVHWNSQSSDLISNAPSLGEAQLLQSEASSVQVISSIRVENKRKLFEAFSFFNCWRPMLTNSNDYVPHILGMRCDSSEIATSLCQIFSDLNCPIMRWPDLPFELKHLEGKCRAEIELTHMTIFFFVHEQFDIERYIKLIVNGLDRYLDKI